MFLITHFVFDQSKDGMKDEERTKDHFLGVIGTDVPLHYLQNLILHPWVSEEYMYTSKLSFLGFLGFSQSLKLE